MFGIGFGEMMVIGVLILIAVGPDKLPAMVKTVAKTYRQFRRAATDIRTSTGIDDFLRDEELKELADFRKQKLLAMQKPGALSKPGAGTPGAKPLAPAQKPAYQPPEEERVTAKSPRDGLTLKQRSIENPPQGVDVAEAEHAVDPKRAAKAAAPKSPDVWAAIDTGAPTEKLAPKPASGAD